VTPNPNTCREDSADAATEQAVDSAASNILDVDGLINRCMGNIELAQRVLEKFQQRLPEELAELESALERGNTDEVARVAHRLRGSSASVSAEGIMQAAAEVEDVSREGRAKDIPVCLEHLRKEWQRYLDHPVALSASGAV
jgi:HPt (histidine-containing phosphotransfer) domain-containing protein